MPSGAPLLRAPHFTYDTPATFTRAALPTYNEVSVADRVVKVCAWTDNSADFVYGDGTVLSFCDEMQTFVAITSATNTVLKPCGSSGHTNSDNADSNEGDYFFTSLTLSKYENKVKEALHIYNYYSPRPRIIAGLTAVPCEVWRQHSPIDSLVIAEDRSLFERHGLRATLWCALRRISLSLHGGRATFSVRWPAPAVERNGARSIFVRPVDENGYVTGTLESLRAFHYVWVEQTFPVLDPPEEWAEMLAVAVRLDAEIPLNGAVGSDSIVSATQKQDGEERPTLYRTTPRTAQDRQPCRFSKIKREHVHALIATSQMQNATCNRLIRDPSERVVWRYDADPMGRVPHAVYWGLHPDRIDTVSHLPSPGNSKSNNSSNADAILGCCIPRCTIGSVLAMVREDESVVVAAPQCNSYVIHHLRRDGTHNAYHQGPDGELGLPPVIPQRPHDKNAGEDEQRDGGCNETTSTEGELSSMTARERTDGMVTSRIGATSSLYISGVLEEAPFSALHRGRYLPDVGASCIQLSQLNLASLRAQQQEALGGIATVAAGVQTIGVPGLGGGESSLGVPGEGASVTVEVAATAAAAVDRTRMRIVSNDPALAVAAAEGNVVYLTSAINGVGTFAALTNGTIRCHFDDRTILFLIPAADDREENLVATCLFRDATQCSMRLVKCLPHHPMYRYVAHALQFRRFARLSPEARTAVVEDTAALKLQLLEDTEWRRESEAERELHQLLSRTEALLSGNDELGRVNRSLLHNGNDDPSAYFSGNP
ncbi:hypothetical protein DQ04_05961040 [Trypanosoma grayi]|uniref:hypothetical protein n=1 Tax=Trypanosoma grayi TaxID=71804 RepID=UPI0004F406F0|nr:hypothetical protein DQ04_05961040 [Trypanosoma grayi]KEG09029.1 hypothetical protein DQ04_05961040 [Trypanosoma grayi]